MNPFAKYTLIAISIILLTLLALISILSVSIYFKGISLDFLNDYTKEQVLTYLPDSDISFSGAVIKYDDRHGIYIKSKKAEFLEPRTENSLRANSILIPNLLTFLFGKERYPEIFIENLKVLDSKSGELIQAESVQVLCSAICKINFKNAKLNIPFYKKEINISPTDDMNLEEAFIMFNLRSLLKKGISPTYSFAGSINLDSEESYSTKLDFSTDEMKLKILKFRGDDIYLTEEGIVVIDEGLKGFHANLNLNAKPHALGEIASIDPDSKLKAILDGFIGWQNLKINGNFIYNKSLQDIKPLENSKIGLSGVYDFGAYDVEIEFFQDEMKLLVNKLVSDDFYLLEPGTVIIKDNFNEVFANLDFNTKAEALEKFISLTSQKNVQYQFIL